ncbi:GlxA family transcriptional regulator [Ferruginibacter albus]|uniref:GlxA family transcriptional regulator n=1 Tax=Ferruginibacter albus TaxID=2875540 RepID=UPI001CC4B883|nr:helix-turn-helix domain-containing protein [Ferruginibacter albus]UAY52505.1 helix-turn-helix domain-containing protein [Ferruginibacter albus]
MPTKKINVVKPGNKHISIFVPAGDCVLSSVIGSFKVFNEVNAVAKRKELPLPFTIQLVGITEETKLYDGAFSIKPHTTIDKVTHTDLIILPALAGNIPEEVKHNEKAVEWIATHYKKGAEIASLCTGAFLLAATGLMKGKKCATHWIAFDAFRMMYPDVELIKAVVHEEQGIYTNGGAYSFLNLLLYLVEKYVDRETAIYCSKVFEVEINRDSQCSFSIFSGFKMHEDEAIQKAQDFIEENYIEKINVDELAQHCSLSRRNFERRFRKATQYSPAEYIQYLKIEAARRQLETSRYQVNEVMYAVGYNDNKAFRNTFKKITGLSPVEYRNRFQAIG